MLTSMNEMFNISAQIGQECHHLMTDFQSYENHSSKPGGHKICLRVFPEGLTAFLGSSQRGICSLSEHVDTLSGLEWPRKGAALPLEKEESAHPKRTGCH